MLPVALNLRDRLCLVVGAGEEAQRRVRQLRKAGAHVRWVGAPTSDSLDGISPLSRAFEPADLSDCWLVILADQDPEAAANIGELCNAARIFFCAIDQPTHNSFGHMALIEAEPVTIAISTGGAAPGLARRLQQLLGGLITPDVKRYFERSARRRDELAAAPDRKARLLAELQQLQLRGHFEYPDLAAPTTQGSSNTGPDSSGSGGG
jgi:siroheme synthase-like protein